MAGCDNENNDEHDCNSEKRPHTSSHCAIDALPNALELIGRGHAPPCPSTILSIQ